MYATIAKVLRQEIAAGQPEVGVSLPGEHELCARFGASRHTVREALRTLASQGLVERRQGSGTRVVSAAGRTSQYVQSMQSLDELTQYASETVFDIETVRLAACAPGQRFALGGETAPLWLQITGTRRSGGEAICATHVFVHARFAPLLEDLRPGRAFTGTIYNLVQRRAGEQIMGAEQEIASRPLPGAAARRLGLRAGASSMLFVRRYQDGRGGLMVCSLNWHPGERFVYRMRLQFEGA